MEKSKCIGIAERVFAIEADAILRLADRLDGNFDRAIEGIISSQGKVIVCGMGKSGIIGRKIAATFASTGTPSFFMHPGEAYHGDLGMVTKDDVFLAISNSGETEELIKLIPFLKDCGNFLVAMTGSALSTLAKSADVNLDISVKEEACPLRLAPTASTTATLAMGDALAVSLMEEKGFRPENFARFHPGGALGRRLLSRVEDEMVSSELPFVQSGSSMLDVVHAITSSRLGLAIVADVDGYGLITDGDIRRALETKGEEVFSIDAFGLMTAQPLLVSLGTRVEDALSLMHDHRITSLLVVNAGEVVGVFKK